MFGRLLPLFAASAVVLSAFIAAQSVCAQDVGPAEIQAPSSKDKVALPSSDAKVALVIGNAAYRNAPALETSVVDAEAIATMLREAHFDSVDVVINADGDAFRQAVEQFRRKAAGANMAVIYYAGYGLEAVGHSFLVPVDARLPREYNVGVEAISVQTLAAAVKGTKRLGAVLLDACRENPYARGMPSLAGGAPMFSDKEPLPADNVVVAYASRAGQTCDGGSGPHSMFAAALLKSLTVPGLDVRLAFGRARDDMRVLTDNRQELWVAGALEGRPIPLVPSSAADKDGTSEEVKADYILCEKINSRRAWTIFLAAHPNGPYADKAREHLKGLPETSRDILGK